MSLSRITHHSRWRSTSTSPDDMEAANPTQMGKTSQRVAHDLC